MIEKELVIIGGGPAGMSAAISAWECGIRDILILERDTHLGGVLQQCIHNGFGLHKFNEELTGPEYAYRYEKKIIDLKIPFKTNTMVTNLTKDKIITAVNAEDGIIKIKAKSIILAMGCRERPRGALNIPGERPSGIFTAGTAQKLVNMKGYMPGKKVVILGSGDIGLIMARRMTLEGAQVKAVCELMPYSGGLTRNIVQCLDDFGVPLKLSHTIVEIHGKKRVEGVTIARVDDNRQKISGTEEFIECDTILLSVGLIPENELTQNAGIKMDFITNGAIVDEKRATNIDGVFACGNVLHVHDLVDYVSEEAEIAGKSAAEYIQNEKSGKSEKNEKIALKVKKAGHIRYTVPQIINKKSDFNLYFRVDEIVKDGIIEIRDGNEVIYTKKKKKLAPGEMEVIKVTKKMLESVTSGEITAEVR